MIRSSTKRVRTWKVIPQGKKYSTRKNKVILHQHMGFPALVDRKRAIIDFLIKNVKDSLYTSLNIYKANIIILNGALRKIRNIKMIKLSNTKCAKSTHFIIKVIKVPKRIILSQKMKQQII